MLYILRTSMRSYPEPTPGELQVSKQLKGLQRFHVNAFDDLTLMSQASKQTLVFRLQKPR